MEVKREKLKKKNLFSSYITGIVDYDHGEKYAQIAKYFFPEFITAVILYSVPLLVDARWIAHLKSTSAYATLGVTNTLLHMIIKVAEGLSVGTIVMAGQFNGAQKFQEAGKTLINAFWTTVFSGGIVAFLLYVGAEFIYVWHKVPAEMVELGVPFLKMRAIGIFFTFVYFAIIGFLRGIKNTKTPMYIFMVGCGIFLLFDYVLIFGKWGFPEMKLMGSAIASVIQYASMMFFALGYVLFHKDLRSYVIRIFSSLVELSYVKQLMVLSFPVMIDKAALACSYIWIGRCLAPMGTVALASFSVIKDLERFSFLPAIAFAQVITFLVSNDYAKCDWDGIKSMIKKIIFLSSIMVFAILIFCSTYPEQIIRFFDFKGEFCCFAAKIFPVVSVLVFLDVLQLILAGALRGAANVSTVMWTRLIVCALFTAPVAYFCSLFSMENQILKFVCIYGSLYVGNGIMCIVYIRRFRGEKWKRKAIKDVDEN